jgi:hypothetical protein
MAGGTAAEKKRRAAERKNYNVTHPGPRTAAYKSKRQKAIGTAMRNLKSTTGKPVVRGRAVISGNRGGAVVNKGTHKTVTSKPKPAPKPSMSGAHGNASPGLVKKPPPKPIPPAPKYTPKPPAKKPAAGILKSK